MQENKFFLFFSLRNVLYNKLRLFSITITLSIILIFSSLLFSTHGIMYSAEEQRLNDFYNNYSYFLSTGTNTDTRGFSVNDLKTRIDSNDYISITPFLILPYYYDDIGTVSAYIGELSDIRKMVDLKTTLLRKNEVIITSDFGDYKVGDILNFSVEEYSLELTVKEVVSDGILSSRSLFVSKSLIPDFVESPLQQAIFNDLASVCYLKAKNLVDIDKDMAMFDDLIVKKVIDNKALNLTIEINFAAITSILLFIILMVCIVLNSLMKRIFIEKKKLYLTMNSLGGSNRLFLGITLCEFLIYFLLAMVIQIIISPLIAIFLGKVLYTGYLHNIDFLSILYGSILIAVGLISLVLLNYNKFKNKTKEKNISNKDLLVKTISLLIVFYVSTLLLPYKYQGIISTVIFILFIFSLFKLILVVINRYSKKTSTFKLFCLKYIATNKTYYNTIKIIFISFISICSILVMRGYMIEDRLDGLDSYTFDKFIIDIYDYNQDFKDGLEESTDKLKEGKYYKNVYSSSLGYTFNTSFAINSDYFEDFYSYEISDEMLMKFDSDEKYIFLNTTFQVSNNVKVGDTIMIDFIDGNGEVEVLVGGFLEYGAMSQALFSKACMDKINMVLLKGINNKLDSVLQQNSIQMYVLYDVIEYCDSFIKGGIALTNFISYLTLIIITMLIIVIINNSLLFFEEVKNDYGLLKILGLTNEGLIRLLVKEYLMLSIILAILSIIATYILIPLSTYVMILFNYYYAIDVKLINVLIGIILSMFAYLLSMTVFTKKIINFNENKTVRTY